MQLFGRSQLAKYVGVSAAAITKAVKARRLTVIDGRWIDLDAADTIDFLANLVKRRGPLPTPKKASPPKKAPLPKKKKRGNQGGPRIPYLSDAPPPLPDTVAELVEREQQLKVENMKQTVFGRKLKNAAQIGTVVLRSDVERGIIDPIDTVFVRLLTDFSKNFAGRMVPLVRGGADESEVEALMRSEFSSIIKSLKARMEKALRPPLGEER